MAAGVECEVGEAPGQLYGRRVRRLTRDDRLKLFDGRGVVPQPVTAEEEPARPDGPKRADLWPSFGGAGAEPAGDAVRPGVGFGELEGHGAGLDLLFGPGVVDGQLLRLARCQPVGPAVTYPTEGDVVLVAGGRDEGGGGGVVVLLRLGGQSNDCGLGGADRFFGRRG